MRRPAAGDVAPLEDLELLARLRRGDEAAFAELVQRLYGPMLRLAMVHVGNRAESRAVRERRTTPFDDPAVEPERFLPAGERWAGHWASPPRSWEDVPEDRLLSRETRAEVERAVEVLPRAQRAVITLRDVEGMSAAETCELLGLTEGNQRVLLHRARSKVRRALEEYLDETEVAG
jgi:RNA polymerase sigma-70 factor, ECF subfamily